MAKRVYLFFPYFFTCWIKVLDAHHLLCLLNLHPIFWGLLHRRVLTWFFLGNLDFRGAGPIGLAPPSIFCGESQFFRPTPNIMYVPNYFFQDFMRRTCMFATLNDNVFSWHILLTLASSYISWFNEHQTTNKWIKCIFYWEVWIEGWKNFSWLSWRVMCISGYCWCFQVIQVL